MKAETRAFACRRLETERPLKVMCCDSGACRCADRIELIERGAEFRIAAEMVENLADENGPDWVLADDRTRKLAAKLREMADFLRVCSGGMRTSCRFWW